MQDDFQISYAQLTAATRDFIETQIKDYDEHVNRPTGQLAPGYFRHQALGAFFLWSDVTAGGPRERMHDEPALYELAASVEKTVPEQPQDGVQP